MVDTYRAALESKLTAFRDWARGRDLSSCRLVQYLGAERMGALDVPLAEVEQHIEGLVCEGILVDWAQRGGRLYLRVCEGHGPEPPWPKVFAEEHLADVDAILRLAGGHA